MDVESRDAPSVRPAPVPALGVGVSYQESLQGFLTRHVDAYDYVEVVPEVVRVDRGPDTTPRLADDPDKLAFLCDLGAERQVIPHSIGLSIGSAHRFDLDYYRHLVDWYEMFRFPWHSDHLAFSLADEVGRAGEVNAGIMLPVTYDSATLDRVAERVRRVRALIPVPFALENNVDYVRLAPVDYTEGEFVDQLCRRSGARLLLDLHNLYANSRNHGFDPIAELAALPLADVVELHVAGGLEYEGHYLDAHSGAVPDAVWDLLEFVLPRCPNAGGVTFEIVGSWYPALGATRLLDELARLGETWVAARTVAHRASARARSASGSP